MYILTIISEILSEAETVDKLISFSFLSNFVLQKIINQSQMALISNKWTPKFKWWQDIWGFVSEKRAPPKPAVMHIFLFTYYLYKKVGASGFVLGAGTPLRK